MPRPARTLLLEEPPLVVQPTLARVFGLEAALILQQLHYWLVRTRPDPEHFHAGRVWVYNTYGEWQAQLTFLSVESVRRHLNSLERGGAVLSDNWNANPRDRTKWYTIDYDAVDTLVAAHLANLPDASGEIDRPSDQNGQMHVIRIATCNRSESPHATGDSDHMYKVHETTEHETTQQTTQEGVVEGAGTESPPPPPPPTNAALATTPDPLPLPSQAVARYTALFQPPARGHPALEARIKRDVRAAVGAGILLTPAGLEHALLEAAGTDNPWPYAMKIWRDKPNGPPEGAVNGHLAPRGRPAGGPVAEAAASAEQARANADLLRALGGALPDSLGAPG